jgi:hypothetical protein
VLVGTVSPVSPLILTHVFICFQEAPREVSFTVKDIRLAAG